MDTTQLVPSVSIDNMVNQRAAIMQRIQQAHELLREAGEIARAGNLGMPRVVLTTGYARHCAAEADMTAARFSPGRAGARFEHDPSDEGEVMEAARKAIDASAWQYLMHESGLRTLMDATARKKWDEAIMNGDIPELTAPNVRSTFRMLHDARGDMFERGVIACFKGLAWDYKTNLPQKFGRRIVVKYLRSSVTAGRWGSAGTLGSPNYERCSMLDNLVRVMSVLDGKPEPDHRQGWSMRLSHRDKVTDPDASDDYMIVRSCRNGNGHVTFKRLDLVDKMNQIIAKHFPGALPAPK